MTRSSNPPRPSYGAWARLSGDPADGEICDACDNPSTKQQLILDGIVSMLSDKKPAKFHVRCFQFWGYGDARIGSISGVAVIIAIVGVLLVSSGGAPVGTIGSANASPASAAGAKPPAARGRVEVQGSALDDRDRAALGLLVLLGMFEGRRGPWVSAGDRYHVACPE